MKLLLSIIFSCLITIVSSQQLDFQLGHIEYEGESVQTIQVLLDPQPELLESKFEKWMRSNYQVNLKDKSL